MKMKITFLLWTEFKIQSLTRRHNHSPLNLRLLLSSLQLRPTIPLKVFGLFCLLVTYYLLEASDDSSPVKPVAVVADKPVAVDKPPATKPAETKPDPKPEPAKEPEKPKAPDAGLNWADPLTLPKDVVCFQKSFVRACLDSQVIKLNPNDYSETNLPPGFDPQPVKPQPKQGQSFFDLFSSVNCCRND